VCRQLKLWCCVVLCVCAVCCVSARKKVGVRRLCMKVVVLSADDLLYTRCTKTCALFFSFSVVLHLQADAMYILNGPLSPYRIPDFFGVWCKLEQRNFLCMKNVAHNFTFCLSLCKQRLQNKCNALLIYFCIPNWDSSKATVNDFQ